MGVRRLLKAISCLLAVPAVSVIPVRAADYPNKPVTVISDAGAGASVDVATRIVADGLSKMWGQTVAVVNHPGANGSIAAHAASDAVAASEAATRFPANRVYCRSADVCCR